jgi:hypothetical protein
MCSVASEGQAVNGRHMLEAAMEAGYAAMQAAISERLNEHLQLAVEQQLGRQAYVRRQGLGPWIEQEGRCCRCKRRTVRDFMRNGYRERSLLTPLGWGNFALPRIRCVCGGSVRLPWAGLIRPYQRLSDETDVQIQRWYRLGQSLRQLQEVLSHTYIGPLSLQTLLMRVHQMAPTTAVSEVPPILQIDAIWVTQVLPTGRTFPDRSGRQRVRKRRVKRPIFIALGIWPETGQTLVLDWMLGDSEDGEEWTRFLSRLEEAGIRGDQGLQLIIHDGGSGLCSALQTVHFDAAHQRCLFHKIRNIAHAIRLPSGLSRRQRTRKRKAILKPFRAIWQAKQLRTALRRYLQVVRQFRTSQPEAVAALRRNFRQTLSFYAFSDVYEVRHLRTTSRLERLNRTLRRRLRPACALHSDQGLIAMISQQIHAFNAT